MVVEIPYYTIFAPESTETAYGIFIQEGIVIIMSNELPILQKLHGVNFKENVMILLSKSNVSNYVKFIAKFLFEKNISKFKFVKFICIPGLTYISRKGVWG